MTPNTHLGIDPELCGRVSALTPGAATVDLVTTAVMAADAGGLVHGGFIFSAADYAAMLAVNDPNVVLGASESRFTAPVIVGERVSCTATVMRSDGKKRQVDVVATVADRTVFTGTFTCFVLDSHVLTKRIS